MEFIIGGLLAWIVYKLLQNKPASSIELTAEVETRGSYHDFDDRLDNPNWDEDFEVTGYPIPVKATCKLLYTDSKGATTERIVDIKECDSVGRTGLLIGFCHLRHSIRTFRFDRIKRAVDVETGEVIHDLQVYLKSTYENSPTYALQKLLDESYDVIRTLLYLGKADGRLAKDEKQVMLEYCQTQTGNPKIDLNTFEKALWNIDVPTKQAFKLACNRLSKGTETERQTVYELAQHLVTADGRLNPDEKSALEYLERKLAPKLESIAA